MVIFFYLLKIQGEFTNIYVIQSTLRLILVAKNHAVYVDIIGKHALSRLDWNWYDLSGKWYDLVLIDPCSDLDNILSIQFEEYVRKNEIQRNWRGPHKRWSMWFNLSWIFFQIEPEKRSVGMPTGAWCFYYSKNVKDRKIPIKSNWA